MSVLCNVMEKAGGPVVLFLCGSTDVHSIKIDPKDQNSVQHINSYSDHGTCGNLAKYHDVFKSIFQDVKSKIPNATHYVFCNAIGHLPKKVTLIENIKKASKNVIDTGQQTIIPFGFDSFSGVKVCTKRGAKATYLDELNSAAIEFKKPSTSNKLISMAAGVVCIAAVLFSSLYLPMATFMLGVPIAVTSTFFCKRTVKEYKKEVFLEYRNSQSPVEGPSWAYGKLQRLIQENGNDNVVVYDFGGGSGTSYYMDNKELKTSKHAVSTNEYLDINDKESWIQEVVNRMPNDRSEDDVNQPVVKLFFTGKLRNQNNGDWISDLNKRFKTLKINAEAQLLTLDEEGKGHADVIRGIVQNFKL